MITDALWDNLTATEIDTRWFKDPDKIKAFLLDQFCNKRKHLHLKTAGFWKYLIQEILAKDEPAFRVPPAKKFRKWEYDPTVKLWDFDVYARLIPAAGGYSRLDKTPVSNHNKNAAEIFGLEANTAKVTLFRLRREAEKFFERGGEYIPKKLPEPITKVVDPLIYDLDRPVLKGYRQWKNPTYKMIQKSPELSSVILISGRDDDGIPTNKWVDSQDEIIHYDHARFKGFISRLPCPSPTKQNWEYPDFVEEFWTGSVKDGVYEQGFMQVFEGAHAYERALRFCLAELVWKKYNELPFAGDLEGRAVLPMVEDQLTAAGLTTTRVDEFDIKQAYETEEKSEPVPRGFDITLSNCKTGWKIDHSQHGSGEILDVNGDTVCCKFAEAGNVNLRVGAIQRKTGTNLKKVFRLRKAIEKVKNRDISALLLAGSFSSPQTADKSANTVQR